MAKRLRNRRAARVTEGEGEGEKTDVEVVDADLEMEDDVDPQASDVERVLAKAPDADEATRVRRQMAARRRLEEMREAKKLQDLMRDELADDLVY